MSDIIKVYSQSNIADAVGCTRAAINKWDRQGWMPKPDVWLVGTRFCYYSEAAFGRAVLEAEHRWNAWQEAEARRAEEKKAVKKFERRREKAKVGV